MHIITDVAKQIVGRLAVPLRDARGTLLMETLVAVTIFTLVGTSMLSGVSTANIAGRNLHELSIAEHLARNQMEHILAQPYTLPPVQYPTVPIPSEFYGYSVIHNSATMPAFGNSPNFTKLTVSVLHDGEEILQIETRRVRE